MILLSADYSNFIYVLNVLVLSLYCYFKWISLYSCLKKTYIDKRPFFQTWWMICKSKESKHLHLFMNLIPIPACPGYIYTLLPTLPEQIWVFPMQTQLYIFPWWLNFTIFQMISVISTSPDYVKTHFHPDEVIATFPTFPSSPALHRTSLGIIRQRQLGKGESGRLGIYKVPRPRPAPRKDGPLCSPVLIISALLNK